MHISYISPLSGWYLAQAQPDLTAKNPTHTRLEQRKVVETSSSAWKADILTVIRPLHIRTQLTKHYCTITGELGIIVVKGDQQTVRNHSMTVVGVRGLEPPRLSTIAPKATAYCQISPYAHKLRRRDSNSRKMAGSKPATLGHFVTTHYMVRVTGHDPAASCSQSTRSSN